jgi:hypothetical protein
MESIYNYLSKITNLPDTTYFLFLLAKVEFYFNYPYYQQPQFMIELLNDKKKKIGQMSFIDQVYMLYAYKYLNYTITDKEIR